MPSTAFGASSAAWVYDAEGFVADQIVIESMDAAALVVEFRVHHGNDDFFWVEELPAGLTILDVVVPVEAFMVDDQARWLSELSVLVYEFDASGAASGQFASSVLRLAWDDAASVPYLLDDALAAELAPGDAWDLSAPPMAFLEAADVEATMGTDDGVATESDPNPSEVM